MTKSAAHYTRLSPAGPKTFCARTLGLQATYKLQDDLLCGLRLLAENGLRLSTEAFLLAIVPPLSLGNQRILALLVL